ncbi:MAG: thioredoxin-dependent thiol peroxidase [Marinagarivorans sp.]|nr:thioredoxin-dependent thiol peroxidase [Marinagarivorans sp.]
MSFPLVGAKAPEFKLQNQLGEWVHLSDFKGKKVVVYFYPKAMTPGCTTQACGIRDSASAYDAANVVVLAISSDPFERLKKFEDKYGLNFTLLSDEDHAVAESYGVWGLKKFMGREFMGVNRVTFIVGEEGTLLHVMEKVKAASHHEDVLSSIQGL